MSFCANKFEIFTVKWCGCVWKVSRSPPIDSEAAIYLFSFIHSFFFIEFVRIRIKFAPNHSDREKRTKPPGKFLNFLLQITKKRRPGNFDGLCKFLRASTHFLTFFETVFLILPHLSFPTTLTFIRTCTGKSWNNYAALLWSNRCEQIARQNETFSYTKNYYAINHIWRRDSHRDQSCSHILFFEIFNGGQRPC